MELVEGEDLSVRIGRRTMPLVEAQPIARQIADALEAAHEQGRSSRSEAREHQRARARADGTVKVPDFGLAKAVNPVGASSAACLW